LEVSSFLRAGENTIALRIDNRLKVVDPCYNSHSLTDHTQTNWNGIVGEIKLQASGKISFENIAVFPDVKSKIVEICTTVNNSLNKKQKVNLPLMHSLKVREIEPEKNRGNLS